MISGQAVWRRIAGADWAILLTGVALVLVSIRAAQAGGWLSFPLAPYDDIVYLSDGALRLARIGTGDVGAAFAGVTTAVMHVPFMSLTGTLAALAGEHRRVMLSLIHGLIMLAAAYPLVTGAGDRERRSWPWRLALLAWLFVWALPHRVITDGRPDCLAGMVMGFWAVCYLHPRWSRSKALQVWSAVLLLPALLIKENFFPLALAMCGVALPFRALMDLTIRGDDGRRMSLPAIALQHLKVFAVPGVLLVVYVAVRAAPVIQYIRAVLFSEEGLSVWATPMSTAESIRVYVTADGGLFLFGALLPLGVLLVLGALVVSVRRGDRAQLIGWLGLIAMALLSWTVVTITPIKSAFFAAPFAGVVIAASVVALGYLFQPRAVVESLGAPGDDLTALGGPEPERPAAVPRTASAAGPIDWGVAVAAVLAAVVAASLWADRPIRSIQWRTEGAVAGPAVTAMAPVLPNGPGVVTLVGPTGLFNTDQLTTAYSPRVVRGLTLHQCGLEPRAQCEALIAGSTVLVFPGPRLAATMPPVFQSRTYYRDLRTVVRASPEWVQVPTATRDVLVFRRR